MNLNRTSAMMICSACQGEVSEKASFCSWCGFRMTPIGTAEYLAVAEEMAPTSVENPILLTRIKNVEGKASGGWIKMFHGSRSRRGGAAGKTERGPESGTGGMKDQAGAPEMMTFELTRRKVVDDQVYPLTRRATVGSTAERIRADEYGTDPAGANTGGMLQVPKVPPPPETPGDPRSTADEPKEEGRQCGRFPAKVKVGYATEHNFYTGFLENLSSGGLFVATHAPSPIDEVLEVTFSVPGLKRSATAVCRVQWIREYDADMPDMIPGMGLRFIKLGAEASAAVELFIKHRDPIFFTQ